MKKTFDNRRQAKLARAGAGWQGTHRVVKVRTLGVDEYIDTVFMLVEDKHRQMRGQKTGHLTLQSYAGNKTPKGWEQ